MASGFLGGLKALGSGMATGAEKLGSGLRWAGTNINQATPGGWQGGLQRLITGDTTLGRTPRTKPGITPTDVLQAQQRKLPMPQTDMPGTLENPQTTPQAPIPLTPDQVRKQQLVDKVRE